MDLTETVNSEVKKAVFQLKPKQRDGLILTIHHNIKKQRIRFIHTSFNDEGNILASANNDGNIFLVNFSTNKMWNLKTNSCTAIKFSPFQKKTDILVGNTNGTVHLLSINQGFVTGKLIGHKFPVKSICFGNDNYCITSSKHEAIIWDLNTNSKLQVLSLNTKSTIKHILFIPISNDVLGCFDDNIIQIWRTRTFEPIKQIKPTQFNNISVKNITFSRNGLSLLITSNTSHLALFLPNSWEMWKFITLPEYIYSIRFADFIPQPNDGGCNKIVAILTGQGVVYFYDIEENCIISDLITNYEIIQFDCSKKGYYISLVLCSGDIEIYDFMQYVIPSKEPIKVKPLARNKSILRCTSKMKLMAKEQVKEILDFEKLKLILKEYGAYPDSHRTKIWGELLELPNNTAQYNAVINNSTLITFEDLSVKYPLESKIHLKNLRKVLNNLVVWCSFFRHIDYLPVFVFPFVKVFCYNPVLCFEAVCTIIVNWCQYWFEYFPLPPINILAIIENILLEHDPELFEYFNKNSIPSKLYAWTLLESAFSEVLAAPQWLCFWDHVLTNEPGFLLVATVSYNIIQKPTVTTLNEHIEGFYHNQNPIDVKKLISKTYRYLESTSERNHPRQYLNMFTKIEAGKYPDFTNYPKTVMNYETQEKQFKDRLLDIESKEIKLLRQYLQYIDVDDQFGKEEQLRMEQVQQALNERLYIEEAQIKKHEDNVRVLQNVAGDVQHDTNVTYDEDDLLSCYSALLKFKYNIEEAFDGNLTAAIEIQQQELKQEMANAMKVANEPHCLQLLNVATGVAALDNLIKKIEKELCDQKPVVQRRANTKIVELKAETQELAMEVNKLLQILSSVRNRQGNNS